MSHVSFLLRIGGNKHRVPDPLWNHLLTLMSPASRDALVPMLNAETLAPGQVLKHHDEAITRVWFPADCVISVVSTMQDGSVAETYATGRDGLVGLEKIWGGVASIFSFNCQIPGTAYWIDADVMKSFAETHADVGDVVRRYAFCLLTTVGRAAACNLRHPLVQRCARWLLVSQDRVARRHFLLTHDILATMLGVNRPSVSLAAGELQKRNLITYARGHVHVLDRAGLLDASCECYGIVAAELERVLGLRPFT